MSWKSQLFGCLWTSQRQGAVDDAFHPLLLRIRLALCLFFRSISFKKSCPAFSSTAFCTDSATCKDNKSTVAAASVAMRKGLEAGVAEKTYYGHAV